MSYSSHLWTDETPISARWLNEASQQYALAMADRAAHLASPAGIHGSRYYLKTTADTTFFWSSYTTGSDADTIYDDGVEYHASDLLGAALPPGCIMGCRGTDADVPPGWAICNGQIVNGLATPDMRGMFVRGASSTLSPGTVYTWTGAPNITPTATLTIAEHALTLSEIPAHRHSWPDYYNSSGHSVGQGGASTADDTYTSVIRTTGSPDAGTGVAHGHAGSTITFNVFDKRPAYYSLYFTMRTGL